MSTASRVMARGTRNALWLIATLTGAAPVVAQAPDARSALVTVSVSPDTVTIGEPFTIRLRVRAPKVATIAFPEVPSAAGGVDPVDPRSIEEGAPGDLLDRTAVYSFVAWDVGPRGPTFGPVVVAVAGQERSFPTGATNVVVRSLLPADTTERTPRDARAPVPLSGRLWQFIVLGVGLLGLLAWLWIRWRRQKALTTSNREPDAWQAARASFAAIDALSLAEAGEPGRQVIAHVDVMREYIGRRFPDLKATLDPATFLAALGATDFPIMPERVTALVTRDTTVRFAQADISADDAATLSAESRDIVAKLQLAHEARMRAVERPPRPRRR